MLSWLFGNSEPERDNEALRLAFIMHVCDGFGYELPSEQDFIAWCDALDDDDVAFYEDMGMLALQRLAGGDDDTGDFFDAIDMNELRPVWGAYQTTARTWGALSWAARLTAWFHGIPWF